MTLREYIRKIGVAETAAAAGVSVRTVSSWLCDGPSGRVPSIRHVQTLVGASGGKIKSMLDAYGDFDLGARLLRE